MSSVTASVLGLLTAAFMLYFPYQWCRWTRQPERDWGLVWFMGEGAWRDVILALVFTLVPLTLVALRWPAEWGGPLPRTVSFPRALDLLGGGLAAAFIEETFFRGWLQTLLVRKLGPLGGILIATLAFAASHLIVLSSWLRFATFFPGLVMALLRHRNGSVLPGILYHALCNVWAVWWAPI